MRSIDSWVCLHAAAWTCNVYLVQRVAMHVVDCAGHVHIGLLLLYRDSVFLRLMQKLTSTANTTEKALKHTIQKILLWDG